MKTTITTGNHNQNQADLRYFPPIAMFIFFIILVIDNLLHGCVQIFQFEQNFKVKDTNMPWLQVVLFTKFLTV